MFHKRALTAFFFTAALSMALFTGCAEKNADGTVKKKERILPPSSGTHSELLLVMPDELWEGAAGEQFRELYLADVEGLPRDAARDPNIARGPCARGQQRVVPDMLRRALARWRGREAAVRALVLHGMRYGLVEQAWDVLWVGVGCGLGWMAFCVGVDGG